MRTSHRTKSSLRVRQSTRARHRPGRSGPPSHAARRAFRAEGWYRGGWRVSRPAPSHKARSSRQISAEWELISA
jgi:hypothetical protein